MNLTDGGVRVRLLFEREACVGGVRLWLGHIWGLGAPVSAGFPDRFGLVTIGSSEMAQ